MSRPRRPSPGCCAGSAPGFTPSNPTAVPCRPASNRRQDRLGELQLWILDHLGEDLPLERLAAAAGMSSRHFSRRFREEVGVTPAAYVARLRLEEARRRLESGAHSLKDVARTCGFADEQNLRRAFRKHVGVAPSEYRERFG